ADVAAIETQARIVDPKDADVIVTLGGDGFLLRALHEHVHLNKPFYGLNRGTHGFLLNPVAERIELAKLLADAKPVTVHPLRMTAQKTDGTHAQAIAFNEV